jgi:hypothetical protein
MVCGLEEVGKLLDSQARITNQPSQRSRRQLFMIGNCQDNFFAGLFQADVAAALAVFYPAGPLKRF